MKTIHTTLPVYDSLSKQDYRRTRNQLPVHCPRWRLPAMQWNVETDDPGCLCSIRLVDLADNEIEILSSNFLNGERQFNFDHGNVTNAGYDTFADASAFGFTAIKTTAPDVDYVFTDAFAVTKGDSFLVRTELTLNSGTAPQMFIVDTGGTEISNIVRLETGIPYPATDYYFYVLTVTATDATARLRFRNTATELTNYYVEFAISDTCAPAIFSDLTDKYFQYKGGITAGYAGSISYLPLGNYYLKMTTVKNYVYYSEIFAVTDIYPNLITKWENYNYDVGFVSTGTQITSAINTAGDGLAYSDGFSVIAGENIKVIFFLTLTSGTLPVIRLANDAYSIIYDTEAVVIGLNVITLTATITGNVLIYFSNSATNVDFSTSEILVMREYSATHIKINFDNTKDLGDILYQDGFSQTLWLPTQLAPPQSEQIDIGEEKNGIFIAEKIVNKFKFKIFTTMGRELYRAVVRIPLHDDIDIIDEVGNTYSPAVGNIWVNALNWPGFDYVQVEILFNDNNEIYFVSNNANFT